MIGAVIVFFLFPKFKAEKQMLDEFAAEDARTGN